MDFISSPRTQNILFSRASIVQGISTLVIGSWLCHSVVHIDLFKAGTVLAITFLFGRLFHASQSYLAANHSEHFFTYTSKALNIAPLVVFCFTASLLKLSPIQALSTIGMEMLVQATYKTIEPYTYTHLRLTGQYPRTVI